MKNPLSSSLSIAGRTTDIIEREFYRLGIGNPRGSISSAYSTTTKALTGALPERGRPTVGQIQEANVILSSLRSSVRNAAFESLSSGETIGVTSLDRQFRAYGELIPDIERRPNEIEILRSMAIQASVAQVDQQILSAQAVILGGGSVMEITGGDTRAGLVRSGTVLGTVAKWAAYMAGAAFIAYAISRANRGAGAYSKQAVAAMAKNTTETCLNVHGQIQDMASAFILVGTPRFADRIDHPPFHWACRTSMVLYQERFDDGLTEKMLRAAQKRLI